MGLSACSTIGLPVQQLVGAAAIAPNDLRTHADPPETLTLPPVIEEVYVTFQTPSRIWYTVGQGGFLETAGVDEDRDVPISNEYNDPMEVVGFTRANYLLGDKVAEGADVERRYTAGIGGVRPVARADLRSALATFRSNGCGGSTP